MNDFEHNTNDPELHLRGDVEAQDIEALLDRLGQADRDAMSPEVRGRTLDAVSGVLVPAPIALKTPERGSAGAGRMWRFRIAAAALLATGTTVVVVGLQASNSAPEQAPPIATGTPGPAQAPQNDSGWTLASFERDLDEYFELDASLDDGDLTEAVTEWEIRAQAVDADLDASIYGYELGGLDGEGAI